MKYGLQALWRRLERLEAKLPPEGVPSVDLGGYYGYVSAPDPEAYLAGLDTDDPTRVLAEAMGEAARRMTERPCPYEARLAEVEGGTPMTLWQAAEEATRRVTPPAAPGPRRDEVDRGR